MSTPEFLAVLDVIVAVLVAFAPLVCVVGYILILLCVRRIWIFRRNISHLQAYVKMVDIQLDTEQDKPEKLNKVEEAVIPRVRELLTQALEAIPQHQEKLGLRECLALEGVGGQLAAWRLVHDADRHMTDLWPDEHVCAYAVVAKEELKTLDNNTASMLSEAIVKSLDGKKEDCATLRALIKQARELIFGARDDHYEALADWQNRAMWLVGVAAVIIVLIAATPGQNVYLLLGASGGLLARLRKVMSNKPGGFDYGVSWSMLFLAPLIGALTGWGGVLISDLVLALDVLNLPEGVISTTRIEDGSELTHIPETIKTVLALMFGYSATLFEGVMAGAEAALKKKPASGSSEQT